MVYLLLPVSERLLERLFTRPHKFGDHIGFLFDMEVTLSDGPSYKGVSGAFVVEDRLNMILYFGAYPYYYEKHYDEALVVIKGASY